MSRNQKAEQMEDYTSISINKLVDALARLAKVTLKVYNNETIMALLGVSERTLRKYREEELGGYISFGKAFGGCIYIIGVGTLVYGMYIYYMYGKHPELQEQYLLMVNTALDEVYKGNPMHDTLKSMMSGLVSPFFVAMAEVFNKIFTGFIFSLLLAGLLKRRKYIL